MKLMHGLLIVTVTGGMLWAQAPTKTPSQSAGKTPAQTSVKTPALSTKPTVAAATSKAAPATKAPTMAVPKPVSLQPKPVAVQAKSGTAQVKPVTSSQPKPVTTQGKASIKPAAVQIPKTAQVPTTPKSKVVDKSAAAEKKAPPAAPKPTQNAAAPDNPATPAMIKEDASRVSAIPANRRDPFVSPIVRASGGQGPACETGKRCLMVDQIQLKGIVKSPNGYIAVVENAARRAYFLRENDPVFNGSVVKITGDTVVFREQTVDKLGKQGMREVTKRVNAPAV